MNPERKKQTEDYFDEIDGVVLEKIKADSNVKVRTDKVDIEVDKSVPRETFVAGQPFTDQDGVEHELYCNSHPSKRARFECDCSARFNK